MNQPLVVMCSASWDANRDNIREFVHRLLYRLVALNLTANLKSSQVFGHKLTVSEFQSF